MTRSTSVHPHNARATNNAISQTPKLLKSVVRKKLMAIIASNTSRMNFDIFLGRCYFLFRSPPRRLGFRLGLFATLPFGTSLFIFLFFIVEINLECKRCSRYAHDFLDDIENFHPHLPFCSPPF